MAAGTVMVVMKLCSVDDDEDGNDREWTGMKVTIRTAQGKEMRELPIGEKKMLMKMMIDFSAQMMVMIVMAMMKIRDGMRTMISY